MCNYNFQVRSLRKKCNHENKKYFLRSIFGERSILADCSGNIVFDVYGNDPKIDVLFQTYEDTQLDMPVDTAYKLSQNITGFRLDIQTFSQG